MTNLPGSPYRPPSDVGHPPAIPPLVNSTRTAPQAVWLVVFMWIAYFLNYSDRQAVFAMFPVLKSDLQFSDSELGLIGAVFLWVYGFGCPIAGWVADRFSKRWLVIGSLAIWSMVTLATGLINSVMTMLLLRAAMGISESMYMPAAVSLTANAHAPHQRSRAVAILTTAQIAGTFAGALIGGTMAGWGQWRAAFFILGGLGLVYCVPYWIFLRSFDERPVDDRLSSGQDNLTDNRHDGPAVDQMRATIAVEPPAKRTTILAPSYLVLCVVFPIFVFGLWMIYAWLPNFLFEKFQLTLAGAAFVSTSSMQLSMLIGLIAGGFLADAAFKIWRSARQWLLVLSLVGCAPSLYFLGNSNSLLGTTAAATLFGLLGGVFAGNIFAASFEVVPSHTRASAVGWLNFFGAVLSGFAPLIGGAWKQAIGLERLLAATGVAYVLAAILLSASILTWYQRDYQRVH